MPFKKGFSGNPKGRPLGTKNHLSSEIQKSLSELMSQEIIQIRHNLDNLNSKDKLNFLLKLLPYVLPKLIPSEQIQSDKDYRAPQDYSHVPTEVLKELVKHHQGIKEIKKEYNLS